MRQKTGMVLKISGVLLMVVGFVIWLLFNMPENFPDSSPSTTTATLRLMLLVLPGGVLIAIGQKISR
jgi:hypothetical protein